MNGVTIIALCATFIISVLAKLVTNGIERTIKPLGGWSGILYRIDCLRFGEDILTSGKPIPYPLLKELLRFNRAVYRMKRNYYIKRQKRFGLKKRFSYRNVPKPVFSYEFSPELATINHYLCLYA